MFESLEPRIALAAVGLVPVGAQPTGPLSGKIVYTSPGHGWQWSTTLGRYATDRGDNNEIVEDFGNQDQMTFYVDYLFRAGATVVPMRPVGRQTNEVVVDNDSAAVTFTGAWSNSSSAKYYDEDYGAGADAVPYRFASTTTGAETATATYTPNIPQAGLYPVYTWVLRGTDRTSQLYEINHTGGQTQVRVNHSMVGSGWVYLGTYHFNSGSSATLGSVQISNQAAVTGKVVIADAIRFGNGMGDYVGSGAPGISGYPREDENSLHWIARSLGVGTTLSEAASTGNVSAPSNFAEYMNADTNPFGTSVYIGFHSNAGGGRGARGLIDTDSGDRTPHQSDLATYTGRQINQDMQALNGVFEYNWNTGTTHTFTGQFGEIDLGGSAEMDATIIEVAFHDSVEDAALMRDPKARDQLGRSTYEATLEYFDNWGGLSTPVTVPSAPINVRAVSNLSGQVTLNWSAGPTGVNGAAATGFRIYASSDGYGFDGGVAVAGGGTTTATLAGYDPTLPYYFKVVAVNAGGESKASEVMTALPSGGVKQVLVVSGFDRYERTQNFRYPYAHTGDGLVDRVWARHNNRFDYVIQVHTAINAAEPGVHVASTSNEAVISGAVNLADYDTVVWILGEESTVNDTFNATEQTKVEQFIAAGGNLFVSGAEIGWDLDQQNNGRSFYETTLKGNYISDDAGTYTTTAVAGGIFAGVANITFSNGSAFSNLDSQFYNVDTPDVIAPQAGAQAALNYSGGANVAAIQSAGTGGRGSLVMLAFPFETITSAARRQDVIDRVFSYFSLTPPAPAIDLKTRVNGQDADSPTGPSFAVGNMVSITYVVTNVGNVSLSNVAVADSNATFSGGDPNGNSLLDGGETWTYSVTRTVIAGQSTTIGAVSALGNAQTVNDTDPVHYFGAAPAINIETSVNGEDADTPPGPTLTVGSAATFAYVVTNAGNIALTNIAVTDDNGTPGSTADDVIPMYSGGDANGNTLLDLGETWTYATERIVTVGQYTNVGEVNAKDSIGQLVADADAANHFGAAPPENADFNGDDSVDGADFLTWQRGLGTTGAATTADGDANGDGVVDAADLAVWTMHFGSMVEVATASASLVAEEAQPAPAADASAASGAFELSWLAQRATTTAPDSSDLRQPLRRSENLDAFQGHPSHPDRNGREFVVSLLSSAVAERVNRPKSRVSDLDAAVLDEACELLRDWSWRDTVK